MEWLGILGAITGIMALGSIIFAIGKYSGKIDDLIQMKDGVSDSLVKVDTLWDLKDGISAAIIKIDTLWRIYIEDNLIRHSNPGHSNPGGCGMLPDELKGEIQTLLNSNSHWGKEPTLLVIHGIGVEKFAEVARNNKAELGQVLAEVNTYVLDCIRQT